MQKSSETVEVLPFSFWLNPNVVPFLRSESASTSVMQEGTSDGVQIPFNKAPLESAVLAAESEKHGRNTNFSR
ncbi:MAG: hypothetical protein U5L73_01170 [Rhodoferax sp.]|uniref:hypothetical protein n=1 Tax=Rhodoferax sp. TaxID=50421 RepID=UPI002ACE8199|nr:hypothetical protein [Rhodoferax sp.]MDZ7890348.1 hypothetical protein [Rhodoferax sp.]